MAETCGGVEAAGVWHTALGWRAGLGERPHLIGRHLWLIHLGSHRVLGEGDEREGSCVDALGGRREGGCGHARRRRSGEYGGGEERASRGEGQLHRGVAAKGGGGGGGGGGKGGRGGGGGGGGREGGSQIEIEERGPHLFFTEWVEEERGRRGGGREKNRRREKVERQRDLG